MKLGFKSEQQQPREGDSRRGSRFFAVRDKLRSPAPAEPLQVAHEIGARYELVSEKLESAQRVADEIRILATLIGEIRDPIVEEFRERRAEHSELQAALAALETARQRLDELERANLDLVSRAATAEAGLADTESRAAALETIVNDRDSEIEQFRLERSERRGQFNDLEQAHKSALARLSDLEEEVVTLRARAETAELRQRESEALAAKLQQERMLTAQESAVLQKRLEQANVETVQLGGRVAQLDEQLSAERRRVGELEASLLTAESDAAKTVRFLEGRLETQMSNQTSVEGKLEAAIARATKLDELNTSLTHRLAEAALRQKTSEDERLELVVAQERALANARAREQETEAMRREFLSLEAARAAAVERADELARLAQSRETVVKRAERQIAGLKERLEVAQADHARKRAVLDDRLDKVQTQFERERAERAIVEGALETARRDRGRPSDGDDGFGARESA
jgi:crescentin